MRIRHATRSDIENVARLWVHTFPGERSLAERIHDLETGGGYGGIETVEVAEEHGELAGALKLYSMTEYFGGAGLPMMGLAAVAVAPWARRRGVGAEICRHALGASRERGDVMSALYPFRPDFYRRLGWATVGQLHVYRFRPESLATTESAPVRLASSADQPAIMGCYARVARRSNGMIDRSSRSWRRHLDAPATHAFIHTGGDGRGYMLLRYGRSRSSDARPLYIRELVAEDDRVYAELLGWIALQRDLWRVIRYDATPDEHFDVRLRDPRPPAFRATRWLWHPTARVIRGPMLRIVNVGDALTSRRAWGTAPPHSFTLRVTDPVLADNGVPLRVEFDGAMVAIHPASGRDEGGTQLEAEIGTLTQIYAGELGVRAAARLGLAIVSGDLEALDALFRPSASFRLLDEF